MAIVKTSIAGWSREKWELDRQSRKTIGGSDAGAVLGLSKYASPYSLWAQKVGLVHPDDLSDSEAVRLGNDLEEYVAKRFTEATGKKLKRDNHIITNTEYPWAHANVDRLVVGEPDAGFEAKTTSSWDVLKQCREGDFPATWYCQVTHYMMVTGAKRWYLGVLVFGHGFFHFVIERKESEIEALAAAEREFYQRVIEGVPPDTDGSEATTKALREIYRDSEATSIDLLPVEIAVRTYTELGNQIKELERKRDEAQTEIMGYMQESEIGMLGGQKVVSWKTQAGRKSFDKAAFEKDCGKIPEKYYKVGAPSRVFRVK